MPRRSVARLSTANLSYDAKTLLKEVVFAVMKERLSASIRSRTCGEAGLKQYIYYSNSTGNVNFVDVQLPSVVNRFN